MHHFKVYINTVFAFPTSVNKSRPPFQTGQPDDSANKRKGAGLRPPPSIARTVFGRNKKTPLGMQAKTAFDRRAFGRDKKNASIPDGVSGKRLKREIGNGAPNTKGKTRAEKPVRRRPQPPPHCRSRSTALCRQKRSLSGSSTLPSVFPCDSSLSPPAYLL